MTQIVCLSILTFVGLASFAASFYWYFEFFMQRISVLENENNRLKQELWMAKKAAKAKEGM